MNVSDKKIDFRLIDRSAIKYSLVYYASQSSRPYRANINGYYKFKKNDTVST